MEKITYVGFAEHKVTNDPDAVLAALGLGSCMAVILYCPQNRVGGMVHVVLPSSDGRAIQSPGKFADTGIPLLFDEVVKLGGDKDRIYAKMAGGAEILKHYAPGEKLEIGKKNLEACTGTLRRLHIRIRGEETGGARGRTVKLYVGTGRVVVKSMEGEKEL